MSAPQYQTVPYPFDAGPLGHIQGLAVSDPSDPSNHLLHYFGGIPYAQPPVGPYRFRRSRPLAPCYRYGTRANPANFTGGHGVCPQPGWRGPPDTTLWDENCLQLNIYIPTGSPPAEGWPVFFFIHGGFLQWGDANNPPAALTPLLSEDTGFHAIIVQPGYRLNAFGFLSSHSLASEAESRNEPLGNYGFWDQRLALEWTRKNIPLFAGNPSNITVAGYSAGSHSTFMQLAHELYRVPREKAIIRNCIMWSNSPGVQPKTLSEHSAQYAELLTALSIPPDLSESEKLHLLRSTPATRIASVQDSLQQSEFRALSDGAFIPTDLMQQINSGDFAQRMKARGIRLINGECEAEHNLYRHWRTPGNSFPAVFGRLCADYPRDVVEKLLRRYCGSLSDPKLPKGMKDWTILFGHVYADMQVHCLERGFVDRLCRSNDNKTALVPGKNIFRYRIEYRAHCVDETLPPEWGVTHATDMAIWHWGGGKLTQAEKGVVRPWLQALGRFMQGEEEVEWGTEGRDVREVRRLRNDGGTDVWWDELWEEGVRVWELVNGGGDGGGKARL